MSSQAKGPAAAKRRAGPVPPKPLAYDAVDVRPVKRWLERRTTAAGLSLSCSPERRERRIYFDTVDSRFRRAGMCLGQLERDGQAQLALLPLSRSGLTSNHDPSTAQTVPIWDGASDPRTHTGPVGERIRALAGSRAVGRLLELRSRHETLLVQRAEARLAELTLETMEVPLEATETPLSLGRVLVEPEDETEVPELTGLLANMLSECDLQRTRGSRLDTALRAAGLGAPNAIDLGSTDVLASQSVEQVAFAVLRRQFHSVLNHEPGTRLGDDIEALHDMRVATRRMRAAMRLYQPYLSVRTLALAKQLSWLGRALGEVRDLDVQLEQLAAWKQDLDPEDHSALDSIGQALHKRRASARRRMLSALDSRRYEQLLERMTRVLQLGPRKGPSPGRTPIVAVAPDLIEKRFRVVMKHGRRIDAKSAPRCYHELRIRAKRLRYALEFHAAIYGAHDDRMIRKLVALQDLLGDHQDADVALAWLRSLASDRGRRVPSQTAFVVGRLAERYTRQAAKLRRRFPTVFEGIDGKPWRRLRAVMQRRRNKQGGGQP